MRNRELFVITGALTALLLTAALGCAETSPEPGATTAIQEREIPGGHSPQDLDPLTAQRWIDEVRLGTSVDEQGSVVSGESQARFSPETPIYVSMRVADAPAGSVVRVAVYDAAEQEVWSEERSVGTEEPYLSFKIEEGRLDVGRYEARVIVGDERVSVRQLEVLPA
jgi:hypothetical protein